MNSFIILPDNLFTRGDVLSLYKDVNEIIIMEDPVFFNPKYGRNKIVFHRTSMKEYFVWLKRTLAQHRQKITYVNREQILEKGDDIFDYLVGMPSQINMFRLSCTWDYGNKPWERTFNGLPINFHEHPGFILTYRSIRDKCTARHRYSFCDLVKKISPGIKNPPRIQNNHNVTGIHFPENKTYKTARDYVDKHYDFTGLVLHSECKKLATNMVEANELLDRYLTEILPCKLIDINEILGCCLNVGLLTPKTIMDKIRHIDKKIGEYVIVCLCYREYLRMLYLSDCKLYEKNVCALVKPGTNQLMETSFINNKGLSKVYKHILSGGVVNMDALIKYFTIFGYTGESIVDFLRILPQYHSWNSYTLVPKYAEDLHLPRIDYNISVEFDPNYKQKLAGLIAELKKKSKK